MEHHHPERIRKDADITEHWQLITEKAGNSSVNLLTEDRVNMKIRPLNDRVLVVRTEAEQKTAGGIIIPDTAKEKPQEGKVMAVGPGIMKEDGTRTPLDVKAGDRVLFAKYAGSDIRIDGVDHTFMRENDILAVFTE